MRPVVKEVSTEFAPKHDSITTLVHKAVRSGAHRVHTVVHILWKVNFSEPFDGGLGRR
jgi:hypothetical protein